MADVYNTSFRDNAGEAAYPLDPTAGQSVFPHALLLDASVYLPSTFTPPLFIISIDGGIAEDRVRFTIADSTRREICHADCSYEEGSAVLRDEYGRAMGVLVYDTNEMVSFRGAIGNGYVGFVLNDTRLQSECCRFYDVKSMHTVMAVRNSLANRVNIDFVGGCTRDEDGNVHIYGEQSDLGRPLKSINRVACKHAFLLSHAHPNYDDESAIRLETDSGTIKIGKSRDFNG
jgi:hypothetical protein